MNNQDLNAICSDSFSIAGNMSYLPLTIKELMWGLDRNDMFYTHSGVGKNYPVVDRNYPVDSLSYHCKSDDSISPDL